MIRCHLVLRIAALFAVTLLSACAAIGPAPVSLQGTEHWVQSVSAHDGKPLKLYVWEKRRPELELKSLAASGKVVVLAHGATTPGRVGFDLQVDGVSGPTHSLMDYLAARGYDVFALDYQAYGRSDGHPCGRCVTTEVAAKDIGAVVDYVSAQRGVKQVYLLGWSWGTVTTGLFAMQQPDQVRRLAAIDAFVAASTKFKQAPNGVLVDLLGGRMPITDPKKIGAPTLIIMGEKDRLTPISQKPLPGFFADLANNDKQFTIVPGAGHGLHLEKPRARLQLEVLKWFSVDQPGAALDLVSPPQ